LSQEDLHASEHKSRLHILSKTWTLP